MSTLLVRNAAVLATMDGREIPDGGFFARDGWIEQVGPTDELPASADDVFDATDHIVLPGFVNTHHHFYQTLTRAVAAAADAELFDWLVTLYPIWARLTPDDIRVSTQVALAELALSGCTTSSDHLYLFPNGSMLDDEIEAAKEVGLRLHAARGSMSLGRSAGGLPPDSVVEDEASILADTQRLIETYHDPEPGAMTRIVVAPCSPFSVTTQAMVDAAELARHYGVHLHTHLAETRDEDAFCREQFGMPPLAYAEHVGWMGPDVWFAHGVHVDESGIAAMAATGTGVAHCPTSNMRLGSGIAPVTSYLQAGVRVGLGVDGSASNDGSHMIDEARHALLLARVEHGDDPLLEARTALQLATVGGASVLGRNDIGVLAPGKAADFIAIDANRIEFAGVDDLVAAVTLCAPTTVDHSYVHGRPVVSEGRLLGLDLPPLLERHRAAARRLLAGD